jgi:hypothetical protein
VGVFSNIGQRIRSIWRYDKEATPLRLAKASTQSGFPSTGFDLLQAYGYDLLADYLKLEQDLLSRFVDYEEMDDYPEVAAAIDIYADDATQPDTSTRKTVWVTSPDRTVQVMLDGLLNKRLRIDEEVWEIARTLAKYGNDYEEILVDDQGVQGINFMPPPTVRRIEGPRGELFGFVQDFDGRFGYSPQEFKEILARRTSMLGGTGSAVPAPGEERVAALEDWEVVHFRLRGKQRRSIYGYSVLEPARWIWKRLVLMEDAALMFRLQRAPERYAFYVDVGNLPPAEAMAYLGRIRQQYRKKRFISPQTGKLDTKFNPLSQDEDFFIPTRNGQEGTKIDVLGSPVWQHMEDIDYFLNKLFSAMKVPKAYLAQDDQTARAVLSSEDVRFARTVLRVQREICNGLDKICRVHLAALNIDPRDADYRVNMEVPSSIYELAQLEVQNARADLAGRLRDHVDEEYLLKRVLRLNDAEADQVIRGRERDVMNQAVWQAKAEAEAQKMAPAPPEMGGASPPGGAALPGGAELAGEGSFGRGRRPQIYTSIRTRDLQERNDIRMSKQAEDKLEQLLRNDQILRRRIDQLSGLLHDLSSVRK